MRIFWQLCPYIHFFVYLMHTLPRSMCSFVKYWWSVDIWACSLFLSLTVWYTYRLVTLTLFPWIFQGIQYAPRRNVKLKTELIDVDLVRGKSERERDLSIDEFVKENINTCIFIWTNVVIFFQCQERLVNYQENI